MFKRIIFSCLVFSALGGLAAAAYAQATAKKTSPASTSATTTLRQPLPPSTAPTGGGAPKNPDGSTSQKGPMCAKADYTGHWDAPRPLMTACLNKMIEVAPSTAPWNVIAVTDAGVLLEQQTTAMGRPMVEWLVPWSSVLYYDMEGTMVVLHFSR